MERYLILLKKKEYIRYAIAVVVFVIIFYAHLVNLPHTKETYPHIFRIEQGEVLSEISERLKEDDLIRSRSFFNIAALLSGASDSLKSGVYVFEEPITTRALVRRLAEGDFGINTVKVTFPEGSTREEMADIASASLPSFDVSRFMLETKEGYLFPDTYYFFETATAEDVYKQLSQTFTEKIKPYQEEISLSGRTEEEIIIMASILEKEANTPESRRIVADILWRRLEKNMPLQVDATFVYGIGRGTFDLTVDDLKTDGPYNSYVRRGLPPTAISNPGIDAIESALRPTKTQYLYFLTGADGEMYYARTFEGHKDNRLKYLE